MTTARHTRFTIYGTTSNPDALSVAEIDDEDPFPADEITNTITHIEVRAYGDAPWDAFVSVSATDERNARQAWARVAATIKPALDGWFYETRMMTLTTRPVEQPGMM